MRVKTPLALILGLCLALAPVAEGLAKSGSSFSSGGSRSSSSGWSSSSRPSTPSSGWSSSSKPSTSAPSGSSSSSSSSGWSSSPSAAGASSASPAAQSQSVSPSSQPAGGSWSNSAGSSAQSSAKPSGASAFSSSGAASANKAAATKSYQEYQGQFGKTGNPVNPGQVTTSKPIINQDRTFGSYQDYSAYRGNYYAGRGWAAPGYAYNSFSSFGMWDAMFLWFMMSSLSGPSFFHNHQSDPGVQAFKQEAQKLSESNADLKKQLDEVNAKLDAMNKEGVPVDPSAMPKDVDPNVALAQPKIDNTKAEAPKNAASSLFWPIVALVGIGGLGYFLFARRRA